MSFINPRETHTLDIRPDIHPIPAPRGPEHGFFQVAAFFLGLTGSVMLAWGTTLHEHPLFPGTVATVHLFVLGVLTMGLMGVALRQLPLWTRVPLPWPRLTPWILGFLALGALTVFLGVGTNLHRWNLLAASLGVGLACLFFLLQAYVLLFRSPRRDRVMALLALSILSLTGVFVLGGIFLGEYAHGFLPHDRFAMVGTHLTWGIFGWAGILLMVTRLTGMGTDTHPVQLPSFSPLVVPGLFFSLVFIPLVLFTPQADPRWLWPALLPGFVALVAITWAARSHGLDTHNHYGRIGDLLGLLAILTACSWPVWPDERWRFVFGLLILPGWTLSQFFGVYDRLRSGRLGLLHRVIHLLGVALPVAGLFLSWDGLLWRAGGGALLGSAILFIRAERLGDTP
ncbi:MAG: hypothetical protein HQL98_07890 [Magnetococcales bacterium]|nr:hypothetical protein [Magnetococcales bacterium]